MNDKNKNYLDIFTDILIVLIILIVTVFAKIYIVETDNQKTETVKCVAVKEKVERNIRKEAILSRMVAEGKRYSSTTEEDISNIIETESEKKYLLARLVYAEAGNKTDEHQQYVASVVLNRMNSDKFPNSIDEVIYQRNPLQYACVEDGNLDKIPSERAIKNAYYIWDNGSILPENVLYQAEFMQGSGLYKKIDNTYFCYE